MGNWVVTDVFERNGEALEAGHKLIVNQGGTRSSKTYSILQLLFLKALYSKTKLIISVVSYALPHLKLGAMRDLEKIINEYGLFASDSVKNITDSTFFIGQSIIEFFGTDNLGKVNGPSRDVLFINECNFIKAEIFTQLSIRTKGVVFLDFNPTREFWYHTEIQGKVDHALIKSTYLNSAVDGISLLSPIQVERIESKRGNEQWWRVYGLGELGRLEDAILTNWDFGPFDESLSSAYGLDFGSRDPDALVKVAVNKKEMKIYIKEELYQNGLSTRTLGDLVKMKVPAGKLIVGDSAATRTIQDLAGQGINIVPVIKGKVNDDIKMLMDYQLIIDPASYNLSKELNSWVWLDKKGEVPIDEDNHLIDGLRYIARTLIKPYVKRPQQRLL